MYDKETAARFQKFLPSLPDSECWPWSGCKVKKVGYKYGRFSVDGSTVGAHIVAWQLANKSAVPAGMVVRHTCDHPLCCNPKNLVVRSYQQNTQDAIERGRFVSGPIRTRFRWGHEFTDENTL